MATAAGVYKISVDASGAQATLGQLNQGANTLGGGLDRLKAGIDKVDKAAGASTEKGLRAMQFAFGGASGKAAEMVGTLGDVAGMLGSAGPYGLALAGAAFATYKISEAIGEANANAKVFGQGVDAMGSHIRRMRDQELQPGLDMLQKLRQEIENWGLNAEEIGIKNQEGLVLQLEQRLSNLQQAREDNAAKARLEAEQVESAIRIRRAAGETIGQDDRVEYVGRIATAQRLASEAEKRAADVEVELAQARKALAENTSLLLEKQALLNRDNTRPASGARAPGRAAARAPGGKAEAADSTPLEWQMNRVQWQGLSDDNRVQSGLDDAQKAREKRLDDEKRLEEKRAEMYRSAEERLAKFTMDSSATVFDFQQQLRDAGVSEHEIANAQKLASDRLLALRRMQVEQEFQSDAVDLGKSTFGVLTAMSQTYFDEQVTGSKYSAEIAAAYALKAIGDQLVGFGTQQIFKGTALLIESAGADPRGYGLVALGGVAISAGVGMGAGSAKISADVSAKQSADSASKDRGVNSGGGRGGGGGGGGEQVVFVNNYGVYGPSPEDSARQHDQAARIYLRRNGRRA